MRPLTKILIPVLMVTWLAACRSRPTNVESTLVDQVISEFAVERFAYYLRGGSPKSNRELLERVLARHSLRFADFAGPLKRFQPEVHARLIGNQAGR